MPRQTRFPGARFHLVLLGVAALIFFGCIVSPPSLMDDVDASHAQLARNMLQSGDWVIPRLDGVDYVEKAPLPYWLIAISYRIFGIRDWAARVPFACAAILLCWITALYGSWAFRAQSAEHSALGSGPIANRAGFYSGLVLATCVGLFLFTRILLPDAMLTLCICVAFWSFQRTLNEDHEEAHPRRWAALLGAALGVGVMLKGLIALVIPIGGVLTYLAITRQLLRRETWRRNLFVVVMVFLVVAAPWHVLATLRMPPSLDFTMHSGPGQYHGFFWFYFMNEHLLRFLGRRYPHDYNTVPRLVFWLLNLLWLFPWSLYLPEAARLSYKPSDRAGRTRLLALCWIGFLLLFFSFSTTQEYYSLPIYPALALLLGSALSANPALANSRWLKVGTKTAGVLAAIAATAVFALLFLVRGVPATADISRALQQHPDAYTLSLGHLGDLTLRAFAYLRLPLLMAGIAFVIGAAGTWLWSGRRAVAALSIMMVVFFFAARQALVTFDPYLSSRPLAESLRHEPPGQLIVDGAYYPFSSIFFYADRTALLLNGRFNNLEYGSYAPDAPRVFIDDGEFAHLWSSNARYYLVSDGARMVALNQLVAPARLYTVAESGGKFLFTNQPLATRALSLLDPGVGLKENSRNPW